MRKATDVDKLAIFKKYEAFLFDLDGTLWKGKKLLPGAVEFIETLKQNNKKVFYVTNNASKSRAANAEKLTDLGITTDPSEVYSSSFAAAAFLKSTGFSKKAYVVGEEGLVEELAGAGIACVGGPAHRDVAVDFSVQEPHVDIDPEIGAVVVGLDRHISYFKLQYATLCLTTLPGCQFVACNTDARGHFSSHMEWAGAGTMVGALKASSERQPTVVGKPSPFILDHLCRAHKLRHSQCMIIGDRLDTDILWGNEMGAGTCCVLTGVTSEAQLMALGEEDKTRPSFYVDSVADFLSIKAQLAGEGYCSVQ